MELTEERISILTFVWWFAVPAVIGLIMDSGQAFTAMFIVMGLTYKLGHRAGCKETEASIRKYGLDPTWSHIREVDGDFK